MEDRKTQPYTNSQEKKRNLYLFYEIRSIAFSSVYWSRKAKDYYTYEIYRYAPMIKDELFNSIAKEEEVIGVIELEERLNRRIKIEELKVCPLSVSYLIFGNPIVTGTEEEYKTLTDFKEILINGIRRNEKRTIRYEIKYLQNLWKE